MPGLNRSRNGENNNADGCSVELALALNPARSFTAKSFNYCCHCFELLRRQRSLNHQLFLLPRHRFDATTARTNFANHVSKELLGDSQLDSPSLDWSQRIVRPFLGLS